jgi:hypothetical protein
MKIQIKIETRITKDLRPDPNIWKRSRPPACRWWSDRKRRRRPSWLEPRGRRLGEEGEAVWLGVGGIWPDGAPGSGVPSPGIACHGGAPGSGMASSGVAGHGGIWGGVAGGGSGADRPIWLGFLPLGHVFIPGQLDCGLIRRNSRDFCAKT